MAYFQRRTPVAKHTHGIFYFEDGSELRYKDVRIFGTMHLFKKGEEHKTLPLSQLGPKPLDSSFSSGNLKERLSKRTRSIKTALLVQKLVVGLGNIYVDEALFRSGMHPERIANTINVSEADTLYRDILGTLSEGVEKGGSTIRSYVNTQGQIGMFQLVFYMSGRKGEACHNCGTELERISVGGRGTVLCPRCPK
ncbi:DNA-formamidopyrimidine glycosylase [Niallia taxi]|nr:DNA-formamidopyrimidine glycosylase [Niallia taxi]MDE5052306.1 DNA-formamidopyrimidine glycosylase [Niallia taxi]